MKPVVVRVGGYELKAVPIGSGRGRSYVVSLREGGSIELRARSNGSAREWSAELWLPGVTLRTIGSHRDPQDAVDELNLIAKTAETELERTFYGHGKGEV